MNTPLKGFIAAIFISLFCLDVHAQNAEIDSLQDLLGKYIDTDTVRINILNDIAFAYYMIDIEKTLQYAEEADSLSDLINFKKGKALSLNNTGLYYYDKSDYVKALNYFENSLTLFTQIKDKAGAAKSYNNIGIIYELQGDYPKALEYYRRSLNIKKSIGDSLGMASSINNIGIVYQFQGDYPKALDAYQKCLHIETDLSDSSGMAGSYNNIGAIYKELGENSTALNYYERSLNIKKALGDSSGIAGAYNNIGLVHHNLGDYPKASDFYINALNIAKALECKRQLALYYNNIGENYQKLSDYEKACENYQKGLDAAQEISSLSIITRIHTGLCRVCYEKKQYSLALSYGEKAYKTAVEIDYKDLVKDAAEILAKVYAATGNYETAYNFQLIFKSQSDSLINQENIKKITALEYEYKYEQEREMAKVEQDKSDALKEEELKRQKAIRNSFIMGFGLTFLLLVLVFRSFIQKRKANTSLRGQKLIIEDTNEELKAALMLVNDQKDQIENQNKLLQKQNRHITDSINYASRIQTAVLPKADFLNKILPEHFLLFKPRDIISGDFYWAEKVKQYIIVVTADCTGHGVPGAFMSMLGISILNDLVRKEEINQSGLMLEELRKRVKETLWQTEDSHEQTDGMDLTLYTIDTETNILDYSGANNPLYLFRDGELKIYSPNLQPVGVYLREKPFINHTVKLHKGDCLYTFSDGYSDQLGGKKKKKFLEKRFQEVLTEIHREEPEVQKRILEEKLTAWKGNVPQMDDILVLGVRI